MYICFEYFPSKMILNSFESSTLIGGQTINWYQKSGLTLRPHWGYCTWCCCCVCPPEWSYIVHCGVAGFQTLEVSDRGSSFHCELVRFQNLACTCSMIFSQLLDSKWTYMPRYKHMIYFDHHSCSLNPFSGNSALPWGITKGCRS